MEETTYEKRFNDVLEIPGYSKHFLRKIKNVLFSIKVDTYTIEGNVIHCVFNVGTVDIKTSIMISDLTNFKKHFKRYFGLINALRNNHSLYNMGFYDYYKFYHLFLYEVSGKYYLSAKYEFNVNDGLICKTADELYNNILPLLKYKDGIIEEDCCFIPKFSLLKDVQGICKRVVDKFRTDHYHTTACLYKVWNEPYSIFSEAPIYSCADIKQVKKEIFSNTLSAEQEAWLKVYRPKYYIPENSRSRRGRSCSGDTYNIESSLKDGTYNLDVFEKKYKITEEFKKEADELWAVV